MSEPTDTGSLRYPFRAESYLASIPSVIPAGQVAVHNNVRPTRRLGSRGFRAWLAPADAERLERCECGWAPELERHYRVKREGDLSR